MPRFARKELLSKYAEMVRQRRPIVGGGAGTGLSAKCEEAGGIDLIVIYNSGRYRMAGRGSLSGLLAYGNANHVVMEMAHEVLPVVKKTPVLAGVNGTDPFCEFDVFLEEIAAVGFSGMQKFPTVGLIDGTFRQNLEETGMSYSLEVAMIQLAHEKDLLTTPYVFEPQQAEAMARAGADLLVAHMGLTTGGAIGAETAPTLEVCMGRIDAIAQAALDVRSDMIILCHGGPIAEPADAAFVLGKTRHCHGFYGASSMAANREGDYQPDTELQADQLLRPEGGHATYGVRQRPDRCAHRQGVEDHARLQRYAVLPSWRQRKLDRKWIALRPGRLRTAIDAGPGLCA
jgi:predicted TIM-barrel enzyme